jgi:hypothetical protein
MTARWSELPDPVVFELRAFKEGAQPQTAKFAPDWIDEAVDWAERMNDLGFNIYSVRNPIRHDVSGSAKDTDIVAAFFLWADCDDDGAADNIRRFDGPKVNAAVITGRTPGTRVHTYWELQQPCTDMAQWRAMQETVAAHFGSDSTVVNPSRIMRLAGTVSYPDSKKQSRGYIKEMCSLQTYSNPTVTIDQMRRVFGDRTAAKTERLEIDTGPTPLDRERTRIQALEGREWHNAVIRLVASYVSRGLSDDEIHGLTDPLTLPGYTVDQTRREVQVAIDGARKKGWTPEDPQPAFAPVQDAQVEWPTLLSDFNEMALPRREWIYGTDYIRGYVSVVASAGGIGKTSNATVEALAIATGKPLLTVDVKQPCNVWIVNLEDPRSEMQMRTLAAMKHYGIKPDEVRGKLFMDGEDTIDLTLAVENRDGVQINDPMADAMIRKIKENNIGVVIFDPFISTHLVNENSNAAIQAVVALFRRIARETNASICLVHHIRKGNGEDATIDSVRGAGSLIGAARAARVMNRISREEAERVGISSAEAKSVFRIDDGKSNLAPPAEQALYRKMIGVQIDNGEWIGVAVPFELPDEWQGMTDQVVNDILRQIAAGTDGQGVELFSLRPQDKNRWVGSVIANYAFDNPEHQKAPGQIKTILREWLKNGLIEEVDYHSPSQRKDRKGVLTTGRVGGDE